MATYIYIYIYVCIYILYVADVSESASMSEVWG
jgi:hypothetical protein